MTGTEKNAGSPAKLESAKRQMFRCLSPFLLIDIPHASGAEGRDDLVRAEVGSGFECHSVGGHEVLAARRPYLLRPADSSSYGLVREYRSCVTDARNQEEAIE